MPSGPDPDSDPEPRSGRPGSSTPDRPDRPERPKRGLGQNFLVDRNIQRRIIEVANLGSADEVLEIGPGRGALTRHLVGRVAHLILVELDDALAASLAESYGDRSDVTVIHGDVLEVDLEDVSRSAEALRVIGNIPYNITTPILFKFLERPRPADLLLMVQREVADRVVALPGTGEYGALAVGVQSVASVERLLSIPRTAFRPAPRVDSAMVRVTPHRPPVLTPAMEERLRTLTRAAFQWRRKQFQKILRDHPDLGLSREEVLRLAERAGVDLTRRPETFSPEGFIRLSETIESL